MHLIAKLVRILSDWLRRPGLATVLSRLKYLSCLLQNGMSWCHASQAQLSTRDLSKFIGTRKLNGSFFGEQEWPSGLHRLRTARDLKFGTQSAFCVVSKLPGSGPSLLTLDVANGIAFLQSKSALEIDSTHSQSERIDRKFKLKSQLHRVQGCFCSYWLLWNTA